MTSHFDAIKAMRGPSVSQKGWALTADDYDPAPKFEALRWILAFPVYYVLREGLTQSTFAIFHLLHIKGVALLLSSMVAPLVAIVGASVICPRRKVILSMVLAAKEVLIALYVMGGITLILYTSPSNIWETKETPFIICVAMLVTVISSVLAVFFMKARVEAKKTETAGSKHTAWRNNRS